MHLDQEMDGVFSFAGKILKGAVKTSDKIVQGKMAWDATKAAFTAPAPAWPGFPFPVAPPPPQSPLPQSTGERFEVRPIADRALSSLEIRELQALLASPQWNFSPGAIDGLYGPKTAAAIAAFERTNNLPVTGKATLHVLLRLKGLPLSATVRTAGGVPVLDQAANASTPVFQQFPTFETRGASETAATAASDAKSADDRLWTRIIPGAAAVAALLLVLSQSRGR